MGFLKKALGKSIGGKLLGKAIKKDPIASKLVKADPLMQKATGMGKQVSAPKTSVKQALTSRMMKTGGTLPAQASPRASAASGKMQRLGGMNRPARGRRPIP